MKRVERELRKQLDSEKLYLERLEDRRVVPMGSQIDYTMGKIRAYEQALEILAKYKENLG